MVLVQEGVELSARKGLDLDDRMIGIGFREAEKGSGAKREVGLELQIVPETKFEVVAPGSDKFIGDSSGYAVAA